MTDAGDPTFDPEDAAAPAVVRGEAQTDLRPEPARVRAGDQRTRAGDEPATAGAAAEGRTGSMAPGGGGRTDAAAVSGGTAAGTAEEERRSVSGGTAVGTAEEERSPLFRDGEQFAVRWQSVQVTFVDEPRRAVEDADRLVREVLDQLTELFSNQREDLERAWHGGGEASTEDLRVALQRYRSFFERLLAA